MIFENLEELIVTNATDHIWNEILDKTESLRRIQFNEANVDWKSLIEKVFETQPKLELMAFAENGFSKFDAICDGIEHGLKSRISTQNGGNFKIALSFDGIHQGTRNIHSARNLSRVTRLLIPTSSRLDNFLLILDYKRKI